jgi:hypothetical protein
MSTDLSRNMKDWQPAIQNVGDIFEDGMLKITDYLGTTDGQFNNIFEDIKSGFTTLQTDVSKLGDESELVNFSKQNLTVSEQMLLTMQNNNLLLEQNLNMSMPNIGLGGISGTPQQILGGMPYSAPNQ